MEGSKTTHRPGACSFDSYIATSALRSSSSVVSIPVYTAIPMLPPVMRARVPSMATGSRNAATTRSATVSAPERASTCSTRIANSSPPSRATVSHPRVALFNRRATTCSMRSPTECPCVSLMFLKWSRSRSITASVLGSRSREAMACETRSRNSPRFAREVSGSWYAW